MPGLYRWDVLPYKQSNGFSVFQLSKVLQCLKVSKCQSVCTSSALESGLKTHDSRQMGMHNFIEDIYDDTLSCTHEKKCHKE